MRISLSILIVLLFFSCGNMLWANTKPPAAAIASADPLATEAGFAVLKQGGNAFDAAVAVAATLAVVEPYGSGIGGGGFSLLHVGKTNKDLFIDGRERAPLAAHPRMYLDANGHYMLASSINGPLSAAIPGEPAMLVYLAEHYGRLPLNKTLAPAIRLAKQGFLVNKHYLASARSRYEILIRWPAARKTLLNDGRLPKLGYRIRQPELAKTLEALAKHGKAGFYQGDVAKNLVVGVRAEGGIWTLKDLQEYRVVVRQPLYGKYQNIKLVTAPPPSAGGTTLITILNMLKNYDLPKLSEVKQKQLLVETMRRAYFDRARYLGDPDYVKVPLKTLLSQKYANKLSASINLAKTTSSKSLDKTKWLFSSGNHTTHFSILDQEGNMVASTLSINYRFGSGFMVPKTGVLLNDEMDDFSIKPGVKNVYGLVGRSTANSIAPGKRPLSSMTPTFVLAPDRTGILGTPGGSRIITMVLFGVLRFVDGMSPQDWVAYPRYHHQYMPDEIQYEPGALSKAEIKYLKAKGYRLKNLQRVYGNMQAIEYNHQQQRLRAASDPRGYGRAVVRKTT